MTPPESLPVSCELESQDRSGSCLPDPHSRPSPLPQTSPASCPHPSPVHRVSGSIILPWAEYSASWLNPWQNTFLFVT